MKTAEKPIGADYAKQTSVKPLRYLRCITSVCRRRGNDLKMFLEPNTLHERGGITAVQDRSTIWRTRSVSYLNIYQRTFDDKNVMHACQNHSFGFNDRNSLFGVKQYDISHLQIAIVAFDIIIIIIITMELTPVKTVGSTNSINPISQLESDKFLNNFFPFFR